MPGLLEGLDNVARLVAPWLPDSTPAEAEPELSRSPEGSRQRAPLPKMV